MSKALALSPGTIIDAEFEEPTPAQVFPAPPHGLAYFIYQGQAYVLSPKWLEMIEEPGHEQHDQSQPVTRFRIRFVGLSRKVATL